MCEKHDLWTCKLQLSLLCGWQPDFFSLQTIPFEYRTVSFMQPNLQKSVYRHYTATSFVPALFLSSLASSVHSNLSLCLPSNLPTHPCVSVSVGMPVSLHEPLLSWLSGARCLGGRKDHEGIRYSPINVWYSDPKWPPMDNTICSLSMMTKKHGLWHNQWIWS